MTQDAVASARVSDILTCCSSKCECAALACCKKKIRLDHKAKQSIRKQDNQKTRQLEKDI